MKTYKIYIIVTMFVLMVFGEIAWRQGNYKLETTIEHQLLPEKDTVMARHYHKVDNNKFYIIVTTDSLELWGTMEKRG